MNSPNMFMRRLRRRLRLAVPLLLVYGAVHAGTPVPVANLEAAQVAIANAERVEAGSFAAVDLGEARNKLAAAQQAVSNKKMVAAAQLADESRAAADLAAARTGAAKASEVNANIKRSTATLIEEMQRKSGDKQ